MDVARRGKIDLKNKLGRNLRRKFQLKKKFKIKMMKNNTAII